MSRRQLTLASPLLALFLIASACSSTSSHSTTPPTSSKTGSTSAPSNPVTIGAIVPYSGPYGVVGPEVVAGLQVAVQNINAAGGILGHQVKLAIEQTDGSVTKATAAARTLLAMSPPPLAILPGIVSANILAILPLTTEAKVITVNQAVTPATGDATKYPYNYQLEFSTNDENLATLSALKQLGMSRLGILASDDVAGQAWATTAKANAPKLGLNIVDTELFQGGASDVSVQLAKLKNAGVNGIVLHAAGQDNATVMKGVAELHWTQVQVVGDANSSSIDLEAAIPSSVASQFHGIAPRGALRTGTSPSSSFVDQLKAVSNGNIGSLYISEIDNDLAWTIAWAADSAKATDAGALKSQLDGLQCLQGPGPTSHYVIFPNPRWSATNHTMSDADFGSFWGIVNVSPLVDGTYLGSNLQLAIAPPVSAGSC